MYAGSLLRNRRIDLFSPGGRKKVNSSSKAFYQIRGGWTRAADGTHYLFSASPSTKNGSCTTLREKQRGCVVSFTRPFLLFPPAAALSAFTPYPIIILSALSSRHVVVYYHLSILRGANLRPSGVVARRRFRVDVHHFSVTLVLEQQPRFAVSYYLNTVCVGVRRW